MNILFATGQPYTPQMFGGLQTSSRELAMRLKARGHCVSQLAALMGSGWLGLRGRIIIKLLGHKAVSDMVLGYPVWRAWFPWESMKWVADRMRPDVVVVLARQPVRVALAAQKAGLPVLMMLQDVEFSDHGGEFKELGPVPCVANSKFTADRYRQAFGADPKVVHPLIDGTKYRTETTRENVTFINPHASKGVDIALAVARACPEIPFTFVKTWPLSEEELAQLHQALAALPNVTLRPGVKDMREIYGACRILLAPSRWEEAYGRVASEAQFSGIPVVASSRGGLPESVGNGGIILDPDEPVEKWVRAVKHLWHDQDYYKQLSADALAYVHRPALDPSAQVTMWENAIIEAAANRQV